MKTRTACLRSLVLAAAALGAVTVQAQPTPANHVECAGTNVAARYDRNGSGGVLLINVGRAVHQSSAPHEETTVLGQLLTLETNAVPDAYTDTVTLLLPDVNVQGSQPLTFRTWLYTTRTITSIGGAGLTAGVIQSSRSVSISCTATAAPQ